MIVNLFDREDDETALINLSAALHEATLAGLGTSNAAIIRQLHEQVAAVLKKYV